MNAAEAIPIVLRLASALDLEHGLISLPSGRYERAQILRALYEAISALERMADLDRDEALSAAFAAGRLWERSCHGD